MKRIFVVLISLAIQFLHSNASHATSFKHIGLKEGLSNGFILDMVVDGQGFVWVATESGLNRIAGENVTVFKKDNSGLASDNLRSLCYVKEKSELWVSTRLDGVSIYDCNQGKFRTLSMADGLWSNCVIDIARSERGGVWLLHYHGALQHVSFDGKITTVDVDIPGFAKCCYDDGNNHVYVGHNAEGLSVIDIEKGSVKRFMHDPDDVGSIPGNLVRSVYKDSRGNIWIGTNSGLSRFNPDKEIFYNYSDILAGNNIMSVTESSDGFLWVTSDPGGVSKIDIKAYKGILGEPVVAERISTENSDISSPNARVVVEDSYKNIWIANYSTGVDFIPGRSPVFYTLPYYSGPGERRKLKKIYGVAVDSKGRLWLGGEDDLSLFEPDKSVKRYNVSPRDGRKESVVRVVRQDSDGRIWLGLTDSGVQVFNPLTGTIDIVDLGEDYLDIWSFCEYESGQMWIGTESGVFIFLDGSVMKADKINSRLNSAVVNSIMKDSHGNMWIGGLGGGVDVFDKNGEFIRRVNGLPSSEINHIIEDSNENVWIATYEGVAKVAGDSVSVYGCVQGLQDSHVRGLAEDRFGNIWMSTYTGISCLKKGTGIIHNYDFNDGVPMGGFVEGSAAVLPDGAICFGSPEGVCLFNPHSLNEDMPVSPIEIIDVSDIDSGSFRISFTVSDYSQVGNVEYAYKLDGLDNKWHSTEGESYVLLRNLPPGKYVFQLKARDKNGEWNEDGIMSVPLEVAPPLWQTWWARCFYIVAVVGILAFVVHAYNRHVFLKKSLVLRQESLEIEKKRRRDEGELNNERLAFYTNIAHELRTPLTLIVGPLEDLKHDSELLPKYKGKVSLIYENALRLLGLINQIMEFRKTETQHRTLVMVKGNPSDLLKEIGLRYRELNRNEKLSIDITVCDVAEIYYDPDVVVTVMNNLISNAIKYTEEGSVVIGLRAAVRDSVNVVEFYVKDTGLGIGKDELSHIFDRYYRADSRRNITGSGIGLALVRSLAEMHKGSIYVESEPGKGSTFVFSLLVDEFYPEYQHKEKESSVVLFEKEDMEEPESEDSSESVLVVEDNADIRNYIIESLKDTYNVIEAADGKYGIDMALEYMPSVVVSDVMMPEIDGIELCHRLKTDIRTCHIPVILLTAKDSIADKETGYENGADSYITKPFSAGLLRKRIRNLLTIRRMITRQILGGRMIQEPEAEHLETASDEERTSPVINSLDQAFLGKLEALYEDNIQADRVDMSFFTDRMNMSYSAFYRKVKALTGMSPVDYFKKYKVKYSCGLLITGIYSVSEIAIMIGVSTSYFHRIFKKETGYTPSEYVKVHSKR